MNLERSRKILRYAGILAIIGGLIATMIGIMLTTGKAQLTQGTLQLAGSNEMIGNESRTDGILATFSGAFGLAEGVCSFLASKKNKFGNIAWFFSLLSFVSNLGNCGSQIHENGFTLLNIINLLISFAVCGVIFASANKVRKAHKTAAA
ncbi:MAG: hypothetical protein IJI44_05110 [Erysipelotrichaceae bacterium]|nr:hypothetical protein [Erysipelotrichaceae bacterium]